MSMNKGGQNPPNESSVRPTSPRGSDDSKMPTNAINVIKPYKWEGMWVFDDFDRGLVREPFVAGIDKMIDAVLMAKGINGKNGFLMLFSDAEFKGAEIVVEWLRFECNGDIYQLKGLGAMADGFPPMEGWLCPALRKYYKDAPDKLYVQAKGI